ncbi:MAG: AIR synthase family protein [Anaerolineales bacterium]|nr:AIR synthase family protein [Anaerolineales bacterium]
MPHQQDKSRSPFYPVGKLPYEVLARLVAQAPVTDPRVILGPGVGLDCAVLDVGEQLLVLKTDPITFTTSEIGWYGVQVNANDIATSGAEPRWFLATLLLPEHQTTPALVEDIIEQISSACLKIGVSLIGGHTEITYDLERPLLVGTMIGEVSRDRLITPRGAAPGDRILLTKGVPIEATAILAREFGGDLEGVLSADEIDQARNFLYQPGISVVQDAQVAIRSGKVTAMHDPTEGGLAGALWELAEASGCSLVVDTNVVNVPQLSARICAAFGLDPLAAIASGALLLTVPQRDVLPVCQALEGEGIHCSEIGLVEAGQFSVWQRRGKERVLLPRPERDEITRVFFKKDCQNLDEF